LEIIFQTFLRLPKTFETLPKTFLTSAKTFLTATKGLAVVPKTLPAAAEILAGTIHGNQTVTCPMVGRVVEHQQ
jgi:hypothetical protein